MRTILIAAHVACTHCHAYEPPPDELAATNRALDKWLTVAKDSSNRTPEEAIWEMGRGIRKLVRDDIYPSPMREETHRAVQQALVSIPGHAEYFGEKIRNDDILLETGRGHEVQGGVVWDFETLGQLPSPETVKVLGSFLDDERHRIDPPPIADVAPVAANDLLAARALHSLKILNPPLQNRPGGYDDIQPWRLWFAQVQAGTRTFRFEGDPQEYSLAGPVSKAVEPAVSRSQSSGATQTSQETVAITSKLPVLPLVGAMILLAAAIAFAMKKKRPSAAAG